MNKLIDLTMLSAAFALAACSAEQRAEDRGTDATRESGTTASDTAPTFQGKGDLTSAAGAGADTAAMDGGKAGDDGTQPAPDQGEGGPADALTGSDSGGGNKSVR
jgi:hypothetical protein